MILDGKNLDMEALMVQLDMESFFSFCASNWFGARTKHAIDDLGEIKRTIAKDDDIEAELEDKKNSWTNQMLILEHYLGNRPRQMHWHFKMIFYKCNMKLVNKLETKLWTVNSTMKILYNQM